VSQCPLNVPGCVFQPGTSRHSHPAPDLVALGERCWCGANAWRVTFGGPLPARVVCAGCLEGFNISQRLRDCGKPDVRTYRSNR
jgi:hypothetical protein